MKMVHHHHHQVEEWGIPVNIGLHMTVRHHLIADPLARRL
jgi:hypothetical protein